jgi:hypothetical protein
MRVRCERLLVIAGERRGTPVDSFPGNWLRVGDEYLVLAIRVEAQPPRGVMPVDLQVSDELGDPLWVPAAMFSVSSSRLPSSWRAMLRDDGQLEMAPEAWLHDEFWNRFYSEDTATTVRAREEFRRDVAAMEAEDHV